MVALHDLAEMIQRHSLFVLLVFVATSSSSSSAQSVSTAVESRETKTSVWWPIVECVFLDDVNKCLQDRTVRAFVGLDRNDDIHIDSEKETVKMPGEEEEGIFEMLGDLVSDGITRIFQDDDKKDEDDEDDEEEDDEETYEVEPADSGDSNKVGHADSRTVAVDGDVHRDVETGRGKKKKKKKKIKKAIIKLIIFIILLKLKFVKLLYIFGKFLQFKLVLLITINTIINVIRFIMEWRNRRQPENVMYSYEQAHHQHHYDEQHHVDPVFQEEDKGWLSGLWSRSGSYDGSRGVSPVEYAHNIAYSAQKPSQNSAYSAQKLSQDPTRSTQTSAQDSTRYRQTATQH